MPSPSGGANKRTKAEFSLQRIHELAAAEQIALGSSRVEQHIYALEYTMADVCRCLQNLTEENYRESVNYGDHKGWLDVYLYEHTVQDSSSVLRTDPLYIKPK